MKNLKSGNLEISLTKKEQTLRMKWLGRSDEQNPQEKLSPFAESVVNTLGEPEVEIEFRELEYMNSSTVPSIIYLLKSLNAKGVDVRCYYDKESDWQSASFRALETLAEALPHIRIEGL